MSVMLDRQSSRDRLALAGLAGIVVFLHRGALFSGGVIYKRDVHLVWQPRIEVELDRVVDDACQRDAPLRRGESSGAISAQEPADAALQSQVS